MSYILQALDKADRDRRRTDKDQNLAEVEAPAWSDSRVLRSKAGYLQPRYLIGASLAVLLLVVGGGLAVWRASAPDSVDSQADVSAPVAAAPQQPVPQVPPPLPRVEPQAPSPVVTSPLSTDPVLPSIQGVLYLDDAPQNSRVITTEGSYRIGETLSSGWQIEAIEPDQVTFQRDGQRTSVQP